MDTPDPSQRRSREKSGSTTQDQPPSKNVGAAQTARRLITDARDPSRSVSPRLTARHGQSRTREKPAVGDTVQSTRRSTASTRSPSQSVSPRSTAQHDQARTRERSAAGDTIQSTRRATAGTRTRYQPLSPRSAAQQPKPRARGPEVLQDPNRITQASLRRALESHNQVRLICEDAVENLKLDERGQSSRTGSALSKPESVLSRPGSAGRKIQIGVETEFMIAARNEEHSRPSLEGFVEVLANQHNKHVQGPRMRPSLRPCFDYDDYQRWCLVLDESLGPDMGSPWPIELVTPILEARSNSTWRKDVEATWRNVKSNTIITKNKLCSTHVHISLDPPYSLHEVKQIAQAAVHFEPALEALVPKSRRGNPYAKSNWLNGAFFAAKAGTRAELVAHIEKQLDLAQIVRAMQGLHDRNFGWNFYNLQIGKRLTVEFRKPPASTTAEEALSWAEFAMSFIQSSIMCESAVVLQKIPPHVGGLRCFLTKSYLPEVNEPRRLERILTGANPSAFETSTYVEVDGPLDGERKPRLETKLSLDRALIKASAREARQPYW